MGLRPPRAAAAPPHQSQAVLALARRRINVLWAMLQQRTCFQANFKYAA